MAESVKITDLPQISSLTPQDIVPIVDESETQTSRATLSQIQNLGPGVNTVSDEHIQNGHIPSDKTGLSTRNRIIWTGPSGNTTVLNSAVSTVPEAQSNEVVDVSTGTSVTRYQGQELPCTDFGAQMLSARNSTDGAALINSGREFTNGIFLNGGSEDAPAYSWIDDTTSGFFSDSPGYLRYSAGGMALWQISPDGVHYGAQYPTPSIGDAAIDEDDVVFVPRYGVAAYVSIEPATGGALFTLSGHDRVLKYFTGTYGYLGSNNPYNNGKGDALDWNRNVGVLAADTGSDASPYTSANDQTNIPTVYKLNATTNSSSLLYQALTYHGFTNIRVSRRDPHHYSFTGVTTAFHSPGDDFHWQVTNQGVANNPIVGPSKSNQPWIGWLQFQKVSIDFNVIRSQNIVNVGIANTDEYTFTFGQPMPDTKYCVVHGDEDSAGTARSAICISKSTTQFVMKLASGANAHDIIVVR
jgi:hypothetical protein